MNSFDWQFGSVLRCLALGVALGAFSQASHATALTPSLEDRGTACEEAAPIVTVPSLSLDFLLESRKEGGRPEITVGYYDLAQGLLAGYESHSGKRIMLRARWRTDGGVSVSAAHLNSSTGQIEQLMGPSAQIDPATGRRTFDVAGANLLSSLRSGVLKRRGPDATDRLGEFALGEAGQAFFEAVPALYAALEPLEDDPRLASLQTPFGVTLTALQLSTGIHSGFENANAVLGQARANGLRDACAGQTCQYRGRHFTIQSSGLFDTVAKGRKITGRKSFQCGMSLAPQALPLSIPGIMKNGDGNCTDPGGCFGYCGPGCMTPGDIITPQCVGHDLCVCEWGDAACIFSVPDDCDGCDDLLDAIWSWLDGLFGDSYDE
jgi:hypothetical protein